MFFVYLGKGYSFSKWSFKWEIAQYLFRQSWPLTLAGLMVTVNARIDQIMLREMTSEAVVGIYSAAVKISEVLFFIPHIAKQAIYPNLIKLNKEDELTFNLKLQQILTFLCLIAYFSILFFIFFSKKIILLLFGEQFLEAYRALIVLVFIFPFVCLDVTKNSYLIIKNLTPYKLIFSLSAAIINVIANLILIPQYDDGRLLCVVVIFCGVFLFSFFFLSKTTRLARYFDALLTSARAKRFMARN